MVTAVAAGVTGGGGGVSFARSLPRAGSLTSPPPRRRARQCQGRCSRGQLTSGDARGTRRRLCRGAVETRASNQSVVRLPGTRSALFIGDGGGAARYSGARAVLTSQVPEVARGAAAAPPEASDPGQPATAARPLYFIRCSGDDGSRRLLEYTYRVGGDRPRVAG
ncbi:unnamed protein product [Chilo suppressalis]|uniref:Uncharacterized protein n=1 Tax=Chilo suppressalis TaxID=168631 RepID=A0ABN8BI03_CHISP|nr:unnamed protein product [Chilo suppressalis]